MSDYTPKFALGGGPFTMTASGAIVGGDVVVMNGSDTVSSSGAAGVGIGVAAHDAATGAKVTVWPLKCVHETLAGVGGATAGQPLKVGASAGKLVVWVTGTDGAEKWVGNALNTAIADATLRWIGR
jgi:hypothetical protein